MAPPITEPAVVAYAAAHSTASSPALDAVARSTEAWSDKPGLMIDATEARLLSILVALTGARRVLEIGTFTGYSALAMFEAMPAEGHIDTLEADPAHAAKAAEHVSAAGAAERVAIHRGPALASLEGLPGPYDLAFIDADKTGYPDYYEAVVPKMRSGGLIVADNVLRRGDVADLGQSRPDVVVMRAFNERAATDPRVETVLLTIRDGVSLIRVR